MRHTLSRRKIIPLPTMRANPETSPEALHDPGTTVMAIYPQTTCFYKGVIKEAPSSPADDYEVLFEDPSYGDGYSPPLSVAQRLTKPTFKSCLSLEFQIHNSSGGEEKREVNEVLPASDELIVSGIYRMPIYRTFSYIE